MSVFTQAPNVELLFPHKLTTPTKQTLRRKLFITSWRWRRHPSKSSMLLPWGVKLACLMIGSPVPRTCQVIPRLSTKCLLMNLKPMRLLALRNPSLCQNLRSQVAERNAPLQHLLTSWRQQHPPLRDEAVSVPK